METTAQLVDRLKDAGEDFEFYPTTREMVRMIWESRRKPYKDESGYNVTGFGDVLDIGCGTCNFKRWIDDLNAPFLQDDRHGSAAVTMDQYYVMEKSRILIEKLDAKTVVLGTDFHESTLIDKPVDTIFCNPPYSEFEDWTVRIITESACKDIFLIIPHRWKKSEKILLALKKMKLSLEPHQVDKFGGMSHYRFEHTDVEVLGSADFLDADRVARAKVDIVHISKEYSKKDAGFDKFFDDVFQMPEDRGDKYDFEYQERKAEADALKAELMTGKNKIEILYAGYTQKQHDLFEHFKTICKLDAGTLEAIGVRKDAVKSALKKNFEGLKNLYWQAAFDCLDEITSRLTSTSRNALLERFTMLKKVDFTASNIYALVIWVIKNANTYTEKQMIDFFMALSSKENIKNYVSNKRVFEQDRWRYVRQGDFSHYTLDYRIICTKHALPGGGCYEASWNPKPVQDAYRYKISDICTVANNLGFPAADIDLPLSYGKLGTVHTTINGKRTLLFEFRCYHNDNVHVKFNMEFMKALNVAVARKLGWIKNASDIAREFTPEMADGAERYFNAFQGIAMDAGSSLLLTDGGKPEEPENEAPAETAQEDEEPEKDFIDGTLF